MYLKNIVIKNIGPIDELSVELPFKGNGEPKPIIFVGENGTGKTILQSQIIDAFYEIGNKLFEDIGIKNGLNWSYYKVSGGLNLQTGKDFGFTLLQFINHEQTVIEYFDKIGKIQNIDFTSFISNFMLLPNNLDNNQKTITTITDEESEQLKNEWIQCVHFYQPANRYEEPFWKNDPFVNKVHFEDKKRFSNRLAKEIEIISSTKENKSFLMDLVLDFVNISNNKIDLINWENINITLRMIKKREDIRFGIGPRGRNRVSIVELNNDGSVKKQLIPSVDNLSLGESILLNLFINIIRHGDNPPKKASEISGIVAIDEIDVHLHTTLQSSVLPELIQHFPKIQFIITTHSPLFLLGMQKIFGDDGFEIRNMPSGELISVERFSEFENAYNFMKETTKFEEDVKEQIKNNLKPILLLEGQTDKLIFETAWKTLNEGKEFPFLIMDIKDGHNAKDVKFELEKADTFQNTNVFGIFDFDEEGFNNWNGLNKNDWNIFNIMYIKKHKNKNYYALLLPCLDITFENSDLKNQIFDGNNSSLENKTVFQIEHMFYDCLNETDKNLYFDVDSIYGGKIIKFKQSKKNEFCQIICNNASEDKFAHFQIIFEKINSFIL